MAAASPSRSSTARATADRLILGALLASVLVAQAIGLHYGQLTTALLVGGALAAIGAAAHVMAAGSLPGRMVLAGALMASVALHIQLGRGTLEFHFGVFVTLGLLLVYRDWRPLVLAAGLIAVHHIAFDRLQAAGLGVYCLAEPSFLMILMHAGYVIMQTGFGIYMTTVMKRDAAAGEELGRLVDHVSGENGAVALDVDSVPVHTPQAQQLKRTLVLLNTAMTTVRDNIGNIQTASGEIAGGSADLSHRTEQTASSLQQTASSMEELTGSVRHSADAAAQANQMAGAAVQAAQRGGAVVEQVVTNMEDISTSSRRIADIIGTIDGIAFQTNILALNAAVEAARAGEQGRGFAVVAGEVRNLAQRSAEAAREIKTLISASVEKVESGSRLVQEAGTTMGEIVAGIQRVSDIIGEISAAAGEQRQGIGQVNQAVTQLDGMTQQNAALVEESAAAAESLKEQAAQMAVVLQRFRLGHGQDHALA